MLKGKYRDFFRRIKTTIPTERLITDPLRTIAYGSDASFYRLIPKIVINVETELEVQRILREAGTLELPVTFRAADLPSRRHQPLRPGDHRFHPGPHGHGLEWIQCL
jgi:hypothetical protein